MNFHDRDLKKQYNKKIYTTNSQWQQLSLSQTLITNEILNQV